jgi:hypothetical protein
MTTLIANTPDIRDTQAADPANVLQRLNEFLRDEIAAEVAYRMTAERLDGSPDLPYLGLARQFQEEHGLAAEAIRDQITQLGGEPADAQGSLGAWAAGAKSPPGLFPQGRDGVSAIQHLRDGELHNFESYCVASASLDAGSRQLLQNLLIPTQRRHVRVLNELLGD